MRFLRGASGLTLDQVARAVGSRKGYVSSIETGQMRPPSSKFISRFARLYSVDEKELLRLAYAEKAPELIRDEIIRALWP
jgi:transcriptional regulator with XRE-family HTH domain